MDMRNNNTRAIIQIMNGTSDSGVQIPDEDLHSHKVDDVQSNKPTRWWTWVKEVSGDARPTDIANHAGVDQSHVSRWKSGYLPSIPFIVKVAEAYGRSPLEALVAAEMLTDDQVKMTAVGYRTVQEIPTRLLMYEIERRITAAESGGDDAIADDDHE